ncbi:MAG: hypothetical protein ACTSQF_04145 [Candidatus Heimdallarchaeaceae archaeon]
MTLEKAIEEIKKMFWGVLKGQFNPEEEEDVKTHLITNLATLTSYAKTCLPPDQKKEYEKHFTKAKDVLLKFDSAGPWFRELPEMIDTVYNVITYANMLQIEYHRFNGTENDSVQYMNAKLEALEMQVNSLTEEIKKIKKKQKMTLTQDHEPVTIDETKLKPIDGELEFEAEFPVEAEEELEVFEETVNAAPIEIKEIDKPSEKDIELIEETKDFVEEEDEDEDEEEVIDDAQDLIEGIELASQYEFEQEPFVQNIESEQEALKQLANLLSALDPGDDIVISPLTEKLLTIREDDEIETVEEIPSIETGVIVEEDLSEEEIAEVHEYRSSVSRLSHVLSSPTDLEDAAEFVSSIKKTIADVSKDKDFEVGEKSKLTQIIESEVGEVEKSPVQTEDIENVIKHLETRRQKAIERIQQLEEALNSEKIDEEEWQELRIKAERHMLRVEDTLDGYKRYLTKLHVKPTE